MLSTTKERNGINCTKPPCRGVIIVDSSSLIALKTNIPDGNGGYYDKKYLDILPFLARNGYRIVIPEMVAFESGTVLSSGFDLNTLFNSHDIYTKSDLIKLLKDAALPDNSDFISYSSKKNPNICIASKTGPERIDSFCRELKELASKYEERMEAEQDRGKSLLFRRAIAEKVRKFLKSNSNREGWGDKAILSLLAKNCVANGNETIFVLANDNTLRKESNRWSDVKTITDSQLIYSLSVAGLSKYVGIPESIDINDLENKRLSEINNISKSVEYNKQKTRTHKVIEDKTPCNPSNRGTREYVKQIENFEFTRTLRKLKEEVFSSNISEEESPNKPASSQQLELLRRAYTKENYPAGRSGFARW